MLEAFCADRTLHAPCDDKNFVMTSMKLLNFNVNDGQSGVWATTHWFPIKSTILMNDN